MATLNPDNQAYSLIVFLTFLVSATSVAFLRPWAQRVGLVDAPGGHKQHEVHTPLVGGLAILAALTFGWGWIGLGNGVGSEWVLLLASLALVSLTGLLDDLLQLGVVVRFAVQIGASFLLVYGCNVVIGDLGALLSSSPIAMGVFAIPFTLFALVGGINAINMSDGMDGLAGGLTGVTLAMLAIVAAVANAESELVMLLIALAGVLGFLVFNVRCFRRPRAAVFMGDSGSMLLGLLVGYFLITLSQGDQPAMSPVTALWVLGLPLIDTLGVMLRRLLRGHSPFHADRNHLHHILVRRGLSVTRTLLVMLGLQALLGGVGLLGLYWQVPEYLMFYGFLAFGTIYFLGSSHAWKVSEPTSFLRKWIFCVFPRD